MPDVTVDYKNSTITSLSSSGAVALNTAGKYLEDDLTITYTQPLPNLKSVTIKPEDCASSSTQITPETYICETDSSYPGTAISFVNTNQNDIGSPLPNNIKIELNKTYHCNGQLLIKWDDDNTEEYYYINSNFTITSYTSMVSLSFTWEGSTGAVQTFNTIYMRMSYQPYGYRTVLRVFRSGAVTKSGVLLPGSFYQVLQADAEGYDTINLDFNSDPRFYGVYQSLAYHSTLASSAPYVSEWCNSLSNITSFQFAGQSLSGKFIFNSVSDIGQYAFWNCYSLSSAIFPECTTIQTQAFYNCSNLRTVSFPECITIGSYAFQYCSNLRTVSFPECITIGSYAFQYCSSLTTASFPECTAIRIHAFESCTNLDTISFSKCTVIGSYAFSGCTKLYNIVFPLCTTIGSLAFSGCNNLLTVNFPECTTIGSYAFRLCNKLTNISFPKCTTISAYAFTNCTSLVNISFPSCTYIEASGFQYCNNLVSISLPECSVIMSATFYSNLKLASISLPKCTSLNTSVFYGCSSLSAVYLMGSSIPTLGTNVFNNTPMTNSTYLGYYGSIYVPASLLASYKTATNWATYSNRMVGI